MQNVQANATGRKGAPRATQTQSAEVRLAHSPTEAAHLVGCGKTTLFKALASGALRYRKLGRKTLIEDAALRSWITALPIGAPR